MANSFFVKYKWDNEFKKDAVKKLKEAINYAQKIGYKILEVYTFLLLKQNIIHINLKFFQFYIQIIINLGKMLKYFGIIIYARKDVQKCYWMFIKRSGNMCLRKWY